MADDDSSVRVAVRIRPQIAREVIDMCRVCTAVTPGEPQVTLGSDKAFTYDYVFNMDADQESLYNMCVAPLVDGSLDGYNATVLAYGQTGSGKTYTMGTGFDVALPDDQVGIIPRAIRHLFDGIKQRANKAVEAGDPAPEFSVVAQFMELYNEEVIDLFDPVRESAALKGAALGNGPALAPAVAVIPPQGHHKMGGGIRIHEDALGGIYVVGVTMRAVRSAEEALQCLRLGALSRTTASTQMNTQSSRSHAIFTLHVKQQRMVREANENEENGELAVDVVSGNQPTKEFETLTAKFHFVDLAGSERLKRTGATGERAREGISINCGLLALGNVISALGDKSKRALHVPYRDSKLTRLLQDSLGGNSRTVMIACVSPSDRDFMETLNTLKYANRARNIKNRVTINQDKSSRTICLLRQEIQLLQLELMEYKQGKRVVGEDGTETVNDMFYENNMLQNENNNLRMRIKAMQETIDTLSSRNTQILAEKAAGSWINSGADSDVSEMIQGYVKEIEELRAKLLESEFTCQQLRKNAANVRSPTSGTRNFGASPHVAMSGGYDISFGEMPSVGELLEKAKMEVKRDMQQLKQQYKSKRSRSVGVSAGGDEEGGEESGRNGNGMGEDGSEEKGAVEERGEDCEGEEDGEKVEDESGESDSEERGGGDESESETDSEEKEDGDTPEEVNAQYGMELAELTSEINIKQKLIEELELSQRRLQSMRAHYEDKLTQLQRRIQDTQEERDKVLASITGGTGTNQSLSAGSAGADKVKKVKEEYEKRLTDMKKELQRLQAAKKEHARLLRNQTHYETQMRQLRTDLTEMKRAKVKLVNKMKEELTRHKESDLRRAKEIAQLRKETRRNENKIRSLEADKRAKEAVLKRRNEEVSALRKQRAARGATGVLSARAAGHLRVKNGMRRKLSEALLDGGVVREVGEGDWKYLDIFAVPEKNVAFVVLPAASTAKSFSPKAAKQKWQAMEKSITQIALGKQAVSALEMEMERLLQRRDHLGHSLEHALRKHNHAVMSHNTDESVLADLDEQIEGLRANIDYVQESIKECQTNIMQMEVAKEEAAPADVATFVSSLQDLDEARYIIEKLFNMTVNQTCAVSQKESNIKEMEAQLTQEKKTSAVQNELLQHVLTQEQWDVFVRLEGIESGTGDDKEGTSPTYSSNASSRSASPERATSNPSFSIMGPPPPPSTTALTSKARRRTALPSELLYPNQNRGENRDVSGEDSESGDVKSVSEDDASQKGSLTRVPSAPGSLKTLGNRVGGIGVGDAGQSTTVAQPRPSPFLGRRTYDQTQAHLATTSPRLARRNLGPSMSASANASSMPAGSGGYSSLGGRPGSMEQGLDSTPPNSPPGYRRQISREENVFSRLTSGTTVGSEHLPGQGVITLYQGRATPKAPLICTHIAEGHSKPVLSVCATDDLLFTASKDRTVKVWDLRRGEEIESLSGHPNNVVVVRYNEPSRLVFSVSAAYVKVWDLRLSPQSRCIKTLLSSGIGQNGPVVLNTPSRTLSLPAGEVHLNDVALNPNGTTLYTAGGDKVRVWDLRKFAATAKLTGGHQAAIMCLAVGKISEEEDIVVTGSKDHYIKVFEVNGRGSMNNYNPKVNLEPPHYDGIQALALHGDMLFSGSRDMAIKKWDLSKEELVQSVNNAHKDWVCGLTFMPGGGGQMLLSGCRSGVVRLWSSETCHLLGEMQAHSSPINALATNASHVFTACNTGEVKVWKSPQYNAMTMSTGRVFELSL